MINEFLPMGSVIEFQDKKYIIIGYNLVDQCYVCDGYPTDVMDLCKSFKQAKKYQAKYDNYNINKFISFKADFKVIFVGYINEAFLRQRDELYDTDYFEN